MNWFDELKSQALIIFPSMPTSYIENAVQLAVQKFFRETHLLKDETYIDAQCSISDYIIDVPDGRTIVQIKDVFSNRDIEKAPLLNRNWRPIPPAEERFGAGYWVALHFRQPTLSISPEYMLKHGQYCVVYSYAPANKNCELPYSFTGKYMQDLLHGVLGELYLIPMENESQSPQMAKYHLSAFQAAIQAAGVEETQNHTDRPLFMQGGYFI